ncbi:MAG TPA: substrate-binding domain-containing protein [Chthonomonadaceae bacterium]|nr:substrate-binding domain-containing protein [Chthonomonadaceae bacterium]
MFSRRGLFGLMAGAMLAGMAGCNLETPPPAAGPGKTADSTTAAPPKAETATEGKPKAVIGVSLLTLANPFFKDMGDAMTAEGKKNGYEVLITAGEMDAARQRDQVNDFIAKKVNAIILCPCDSRSVGTAIQAANKAGIPVFTADIASLDTASKVVSHIATDNYEGGKLAGQAMVEALGGKGKVAIIDHPEVESVMMRTKGFKEVVANAKGIQIVAQLPGGAQRDTAYKTAQDILEKYPDLAGFFCINDPTAFGAISALEKAGRLAKVKVISFDGQPEARQAVKDGKIYAEPIQYPDKIGATAIQTIARYMAGETVPPQILIPTTLYKKADADKDTSLK